MKPFINVITYEESCQNDHNQPKTCKMVFTNKFPPLGIYIIYIYMFSQSLNIATFFILSSPLLKLPICPRILKNYDFFTLLKISYVYHNLIKNFSYHTQKTNLQNQIFGAKTKKFNPQSINRGNLFSNLIILNFKKKIEVSRRNLGDPAPVQSQENHGWTPVNVRLNRGPAAIFPATEPGLGAQFPATQFFFSFFVE